MSKIKNEKITVSQYDFGFKINIEAVDKNGSNVDVSEENIKVYVITPSSKKFEAESFFNEETNKIEITADERFTEEAGNHSIYIELANAATKTTTIKALYYFVMDYLGGIK